MKKTWTVSCCLLSLACIALGILALRVDRTIGVLVSQDEIATIMGGDCYTTVAGTEQVCTGFCGGVITVQKMGTTPSGGCSAEDICQSGYECKYNSFNNTGCGGG